MLLTIFQSTFRPFFTSISFFRYFYGQPKYFVDKKHGVKEGKHQSKTFTYSTVTTNSCSFSCCNWLVFELFAPSLDKVWVSSAIIFESKYKWIEGVSYIHKWIFYLLTWMWMLSCYFVFLQAYQSFQHREIKILPKRKIKIK